MLPHRPALVTNGGAIPSLGVGVSTDPPWRAGLTMAVHRHCTTPTPLQERRVTSRHTEADARIAIDDRLRRAGRDPFDKSMVGAEVHAAEIPAADAVVDRSRARPFETHAPCTTPTNATAACSRTAASRPGASASTTSSSRPSRSSMPPARGSSCSGKGAPGGRRRPERRRLRCTSATRCWRSWTQTDFIDSELF